MKSFDRESPGGAKRPLKAHELLAGFLGEHDLGGLIHHCRLAKFLTAGGFDIRRIEREDNHADIWVVYMRRGFVPRGEEVQTAQVYIQTFLRRQGVRYPKRDITVRVAGHRVHVAFMWKSGKPGMLIFWGGNLRVSCNPKR